MSLQVVSLLALLAAAAAPTRGQQVQVFCGRQLADALDVLCEDGLLLQRRSPPSPAGGRWATQGVLRGGRGRRQVVEECCLQPCTIDELMTYCA